VIPGARTLAAHLAAASIGAAAVSPALIEERHDIPARAVEAYVAAGAQAGCPWWILATVGRLETNHGRIGGDGTGLIFETHLLDNGKQARESWSDAAAGGPMGFLPSTWDGYAADGDGDGVADLTDIDDAAVGTCKLLLANGFTPDDPSSWDKALGMYNGGGGCWDRCSESINYRAIGVPYAAELAGVEVDYDPATRRMSAAPAGDHRSLSATANRTWDRVVGGWLAIGGRLDGESRATWAKADRAIFGQGGESGAPAKTAARPAPDGDKDDAVVTRCGVTAQAWLADVWCAMVDDAAADGVTLQATSSWRSSEDQRRMRRQNGCPDDTSPASSCDVPAAPVGSSNHEAGEAIDVAGMPGAWAWIASHAGDYGLAVNDGEQWHLSETGM